MYWDIIQATKRMTPAGEKSKSNCVLQKASRPSASTTRPATTPPVTNVASSQDRRSERSGPKVGLHSRGVSLRALAVLPVLFVFSAFFVFSAPCGFAQDNPLALPKSVPAPPNQGPDQQGGTIKVNVNLVVLHTTVLDDRGRFVDGLKEDNFRVFEDKAEQK